MPSSSTEGSPEESRGALGLACERCAGGPPTRPTELVAEALPAGRGESGTPGPGQVTLTASRRPCQAPARTALGPSAAPQPQTREPAAHPAFWDPGASPPTPAG